MKRRTRSGTGSAATARRRGGPAKTAGERRRSRRRADGRASRQALEAGQPPREALLAAAIALFGERGPAAVSTRDVAAAANVNSGLIHRHFRTKSELLQAAMDRLAAEIAAVAESGDGDGMRADHLLQVFDATWERTAYWRLLARTLLDGQDLAGLQTDFPTMRRIVAILERLRHEGLLAPTLEPKALAAALSAMGLGWLVYEPFLTRALGLGDGDAAEARRSVRRLARELLRVIVQPPSSLSRR